MTAKKPAAKRQGRGTTDKVVELVPASNVPAAPDRWSTSTVEAWEAFWTDEELVSVVRGSHHATLVRLFDWRDRLEDAWKLADGLREAVGSDHMVSGSTGQVRANPLYEQAEKAEARALAIEGRVKELEDRFGLTPGAMLKMGVDFQRRQNLASANEKMMEAVSGVNTTNDPRALPGDSPADVG